MAKTFLVLQFLQRTSLCFTDQETQEEIVLGKPTPLWFGSYTSYLLYKAQDLFSACRQSHGQKISSSSIFREDQSLLHRPRNSGRECPWWPNSLVGRFLHHLSLAQSSRSIQRMQTVPWPKQDQSLLHKSTNSWRECTWWTNSLVGQFLHQLSLVQSSRAI